MRIQTLKLWPEREDVELTTFLNTSNDFLEEKRPAVIVCPGGAYRMCPRHGEEGDAVAMAFAVDGYQAFVLEYSVVERAPKGKTLFPAQMLDLAKAILTIRQHAEEWCVDPEKIALIGFSAGAHLSAMLAVSWNAQMLADYFGVDSQLLRPLCAMLIYGLSDYVLQNEENQSRKTINLPWDLNTPTFGAKYPQEEALKAYSPVCHIGKHAVPIFLAAATDDNVISAIQSIYMAEKLQKAGIPYEIHLFEAGGHGFALGRNLLKPYRNDRQYACSSWVQLAKTFLMHRIAPETLEIEQQALDALEKAYH